MGSDYREKMASMAPEYQTLQEISEVAVVTRHTAFGWANGRFYQAYPGGRVVDYTSTVARREYVNER